MNCIPNNDANFDNDRRIVPKQIKLGLILQYMNNLGRLRDTIHFGFDFNPLINNLQRQLKKIAETQNKNA